jgi:hypothetical protein
MNFSVSEFKISDENLMKFFKLVDKPNDCVINALQIIGILDRLNADLMRVAVGDIGLIDTQIKDIFKVVVPSKQWRFLRYTNVKDLAEFTSLYMKPGHVIFCGYEEHKINHVFLVGKTMSGNVLYIDPQEKVVCDLDAQCRRFIENKKAYYILQNSL